MDWYYYIALVTIFMEIFFVIKIANNSRYALSNYKRDHSDHKPRTSLFVPCKGVDTGFEKNITSFFNQDYDNYLLWFVVDEESDPAYKALCKLKEQLERKSKAINIQILIAGHSKCCSQKIHNLLYCYERIGREVENMAFADSDVCVRSDWLSHIVYPLRQDKNGAASGYRWFITKENNTASLALSGVNAKIAQLLGNTSFNQVWGGSMAIRVDVFREVGLDKIWVNALSDDLSMSYAVKRAHKKIAFVPACLVASYESTTWRKLFEFGRRQFLITRVSAPAIWWGGLCGTLYSILGLWAGSTV